MGPVASDWIFLLPCARRHLAAAARCDVRGDVETARAHRALAAAYQLWSEERDYRPQRGTYLRPMAEFATGTVPDMGLVRSEAALDVYRRRLPRTRSLARLGRLADALWEFAGDARAARIAIDAYERIAQAILGRGGEHDAFNGAAALVRAYFLARTLQDQERADHLHELVLAGIDLLAESPNEGAAFFTLVELMLETGSTHGDLERIDAALRKHLELLRGQNRPSHWEQTTLELLGRVARARKDAPAAAALSREFGEAIVREAEAKLAGDPEGGLVAGVFFELAARHFEKLGDHRRAAEIREREQLALRGARFHTVESEVQIDLTPYQRWIEKVVQVGGKEAFWVTWLRAVPLPTADDLSAGVQQRGTRLVDLVTTSYIDDDVIVETPDPAEAKRRRAVAEAYLGIRVHILNLFGVARDRFQVTASSALDVLRPTGHFDETSTELLTRMLTAADARDFVTAAYLSGPLFERLARAIALEQGMVVRGAQSGEAVQYLPIDLILRRIQVDEAVRLFALHVLTRPGLNVRNEVGHGLLETRDCTVNLVATLIFTLCAVALSAHDDDSRASAA